jgi:4-hydroxybenzoate polyprenyltransferase
MDARLIYLIVFMLLFFLAFVLQKKFSIICDTSIQTPKTYSYSRLQLLWWTFIVFASFISIAIASGQIPTFDSSTIILLGIGAATTATARLTDISDRNKYEADKAKAQTEQAKGIPAAMPEPLNKDYQSQGFWLDILSDKNGVSIHRLQALIFNLVFGLWFIYQSVLHLKGVNANTPLNVLNNIIPVIGTNNLILLGLSAGTYAALKTTENK